MIKVRLTQQSSDWLRERAEVWHKYSRTFAYWDSLPALIDALDRKRGFYLNTPDTTLIKVAFALALVHAAGSAAEDANYLFNGGDVIDARELNENIETIREAANVMHALLPLIADLEGVERKV